MAWFHADVTKPGQYILVAVTNGVNIDPLGVTVANELLQRVREYAADWSVSHIDYNTGVLLGIGGHLRFYGRVSGPIPTAVIAAQVVAALNSFWTIGGVDVAVFVSDSPNEPIPDGVADWQTTLQLIAVAVLAVAVVWGISQVKGILDE